MARAPLLAEAVASGVPDVPLDGPPRDVVRGNVRQFPVADVGDGAVRSARATATSGTMVKAEAVASVVPDVPPDGPPRDAVRGNARQPPVTDVRDGDPVMTFCLDALHASRDAFGVASANGLVDYHDLVRQAFNAAFCHALWPSIAPCGQRRILGLMRDVLRTRCAV